MLFGTCALAWTDHYGPIAAELLPGNDAIFIGIVAAPREEKFLRWHRVECEREDASLSASEQQYLRREATSFDDGEDGWREVPSGLQTLRLTQAKDDVTVVSLLL